jgi:hypothetical protein
MSMIKLEKYINRGKFIYKQILRKGRFSIYEQYLKKSKNILGDPNLKDLESYTLIGFEVIAIRRRKAKDIFDKSYPPKETYPSSAEWGTNGFTFQNYKEAMNKFESLVLLADGRKKRNGNK